VSEANPAEPALAAADTFSSSVIPFLEALRGKLEERAADGGNLAVLLIDCGVIGRIDAIWGYHVGDAVRDRVTALLHSDVLRPGDLVGAMGRDEFACVLPAIDDPAVALLAARKSLRALNVPFWVDDDEIHADPAIGIVMSPMHGDQPEVLLQRARSACSLARNLPGRIADYEEGWDDAAKSQLLYENRLHTAVLEDALELVFQPQYDLRLGQIMGAEALLCWRDPAFGMADPEQAFAAAESAEKLSDLVSLILNRALRIVSEFRYSAGLDLRIAIKLPARALRNTELVDVVGRALGTWSRRPGTLILEIGDTALLGTDTVARETLGRLKELGLKLSIDDPGMALPSLFRLASMPFQEIKLDVSAARDLEDAVKSAHIIQSIIELAHRLRLDVVAVGVTDDAAAARLKELGCDLMQADYKGPALGPEEFVQRYGLG
jgi:diguanylate cyclase (GGDEF)-like protein